MGLDTSHDCWHGPYSSFNRWRNELARVAGYQFKKYDYIEAPVIDWDNLTQEQLMGEWENTPADPLIVLIAHADCEGVIHPAQAEPLASRLEYLMGLLPAENMIVGIPNYHSRTQAFIDGLRLAVANGEDVDFH